MAVESLRWPWTQRACPPIRPGCVPTPPRPREADHKDLASIDVGHPEVYGIVFRVDPASANRAEAAAYAVRHGLM
jgi:hypothetical protein